MTLLNHSCYIYCTTVYADCVMSSDLLLQLSSLFYVAPRYRFFTVGQYRSDQRNSIEEAAAAEEKDKEAKKWCCQEKIVTIK